MKSLVVGLIAIALGLVAGCGGSSSNPPTAPPIVSTHLMVQWQTNGTPGGIDCTQVATSTSCISHLVISNITSGVSTSVASTAKSVTILGAPTDIIQIKAVGFNGVGITLTSPVTVVPVL